MRRLVVAAVIGMLWCESVLAQAPMIPVIGGDTSDIPFTATGGATPSSPVARAGHMLNVIDDFGAKCDGSTNDSAAFQNALNSGKDILVPSGVTCVVGNLALNTASGQTFSADGAVLTIASPSNFGIEVEGYEPHLHGIYINDSGATVSQTTVASGLNTSVASATVVSGGAGGSTGTCTLTGTSGAGTVFAGSIALSGASLATGASVTVTTAGSYSVNPVNYQNEPVTATGCGSLAGVTLAFNMTGPASVSVASSSNGPSIQVNQRYQMQESNGAYKRGFVTGVSGTTITLSDPPDVPVVSGAPFWSTFGAIYVTNALGPAIDDVRCNGNWGCLLMDDPNAASDSERGVNKGFVTRITTTSGRMFGVIKGRNVQAMTVSHFSLYGSWSQVDNFTGTGSQTVFPLSFYLNLTRELYSVTVNGVAQTRGTNYTINTSGMGITFLSAPANGSAIVVQYLTYGGEGYEDNCEGVVATACGGNNLTEGSLLQWSDDLYLDQAQLYLGSNIIVDGSAFNNVVFDDTTGTGTLDYLQMFWAANEIKAKNGGAAATILNGSAAPQPSTYPVSGAAGNLSSLDAGTTVDWPGGIKYTNGKVFTNSSQSQSVAYNGEMCWGCPPSVAPDSVFEWYGSLGQMTFNGSGNTLGFTAQYSYVVNSAVNGFLNLEANGTGGSIKLIAGGTTELTCNTSDCAAAVPVALPASTVAALPSCGAGLTGAIAYVTDASSPAYNAALIGGASTQTLAMCNGTNWTAH